MESDTETAHLSCILLFSQKKSGRLAALWKLMLTCCLSLVSKGDTYIHVFVMLSKRRSRRRKIVGESHASSLS